ncbi:hypothetical protein MKW92_052009, partial [Papaver armeniacum]
GFRGFIPHQRAQVRVHVVGWPTNYSNSVAFLVTVLLLFMILNSYRMSHDLLLWLILGVFLMATGFSMYATCQQLQAPAQAHVTAASGLLGRAELRLHMPPSIAFATRGRLEGLRFQLEVWNNGNIRSLDSAYSSSALSEDEINAIPVRKYEIAGLQNESSTIQHASFSVEPEHKKSDAIKSDENLKSTKDGLTCSVCQEQANVGENVRTLPCLHQIHDNCIDPWLRQQGTCPLCKFRAGII